MTTLLEAVERHGVKRTLAANQPLLLDDANVFSIVKTSEVDLFVVDVEGGAPQGRRRFLLSATEGELLCGIRATGNGARGILAVGSSGAELLQVRHSVLQKLATDHDLETAVAELVDGWIMKLSNAIGPSVPPKHHIDLAADQTLTIGEGQISGVGLGVKWMRHSTGDSSFMDMQEVAVSGWTPLSGRTWATTTQGGEIQTSDTSRLISTREVWDSLQAFHDIATQRIHLITEGEQELHQEQLRKKQEIDRAAMGRAVQALASAMDDGLESKQVLTDDHDPLLSVCRLVGEAQGIEFVDPGSDYAVARGVDPLETIARTSRIRTRRVALRDDWWSRDNGPLLAYLEKDSTPVALIPAPGRRYTLVDPSSGTRQYLTPQVAETISSFAHVFYRPFPDRVLTAVELLKFGIQAGSKHDLVTMLSLAVAVGLLALVTPIATGIIFDAIIPSAERQQLFQLAAILAVMTVGSAMFQLTRGIAVLRLEAKMGASVQAGVWDRMLRLPAPFFRDYLAGDLARRSLGIDQIRRLMTGATVSSLLGGLFSIFSFCLLFYYSARLAMVALILMLVAAAATIIAGVRTLRFERALQHISGKIEGLVLQFITGVSKLRVAGAEARAFEVWAKDFAEQRRLAFKAGTIENGLQVFNATFPVVASMCIFGFLVLSASGGEDSLSTGSFLAFNAAFGQFLSASLQMSSVVVSLLLIVPIYERAKPILESSPEVDVARSHPGELSGEIELSHVSFRYTDSGPLILDDVTLEAGPGEFIAIVGPSGAGKSTLLRLLLGFETPESGSVYFDRQDLATVDVQSVRRQTGVVLQNAQVLPGSILENIVGSSRFTIEEATEAAKMAGLDRDIDAMPMGMHTVIMEGGGTLSGGQRQRLLIARAVVSKPRILMFDEATSALDNRTQAHVSESLENLRATRVIIAHRLSTIVNADRIYVMDRGKIVQQGTYQELIEEPGLFAKLAKRQIA